jgi:polysaccharide export outer membrane protein
MWVARAQFGLIHHIGGLIVRLWAFAAFALAIAGCGTTYPPVADSGPRPSIPYLVGPGDALSVVVWRSPELTMAVPVRPDGKITTPLVEDLQASGKTTTQIAREIEKALRPGGSAPAARARCCW